MNAAGSSIRRILKAVSFGFCFVLVLPFLLISWLEKAVSTASVLFTFSAHALSMIPGLPGDYIRAAFYSGALDACSWEVRIGYGSVFVSRRAEVGRSVSTGLYCVFGHVKIGAGTRIASRVSVPSGKHQHFNERGELFEGTRHATVEIGSNCWIGEGAILLDSIGRECVVSAGSVVISSAPDRSLIGGNPSRVIKTIESVMPPMDGT